MAREHKDRKHACDCPDRTGEHCPRHGAVAPQSAESAEALAFQICRYVEDGRDNPRSDAAALIRRRDKARDAATRRAALKEACRAIYERIEMHKAKGGMGDQVEEAECCEMKVAALMEEPTK